MLVEYLKNQAARCMSLARVCFDLETARQLRLMAEDFKAKAGELEQKARQARPMQQAQQQQQHQQQQQNEDE
jgi:hypothetical protein